MLYIVKGKINGRWKSLNTGGVPLETAKFQAIVQSALRGCEIKITEYRPKHSKVK